MIKLYTAGTSNGRRAAIALEEAGLPHETQVLDLGAGDQHRDAYRAINPAEQVPAIVDPDGPGGQPVTVTQSAAILLYAATKSGTLLPNTAQGKIEAMQWLLQAVTDCAPASFGLFVCSPAGPAASEPGSDFFKHRLLTYLGVCNGRLAQREYLCGEYSIADIALYPVVAARAALIADDATYPHLNRWFARISARPAVQRGIQACNPAG